MSHSARPLPEIIGSLHPWLRNRLSSITICPRVGGGWDAQLSYLDHTAPPPVGFNVPAGNAEHPGDTHHLLALSAEDPEGDLAEQLRELEVTATLGQLALQPFHASAMTSGSPGASAAGQRTGHIGWIIRTHADEREQREWRRRVGQTPLPGTRR